MRNPRPAIRPGGDEWQAWHHDDSGVPLPSQREDDQIPGRLAGEREREHRPSQPGQEGATEQPDFGQCPDQQPDVQPDHPRKLQPVALDSPTVESPAGVAARDEQLEDPLGAGDQDENGEQQHRERSVRHHAAHRSSTYSLATPGPSANSTPFVPTGWSSMSESTWSTDDEERLPTESRDFQLAARSA